MKRKNTCLVLLLVAVLFVIFAYFGTGIAQDAKPSNKQSIDEFSKYLSGTVLTGVFTVDGKPLDKLHEERYEIKTARKLEGYDSLWEIVTRIKYGDKNVELPVEINVEWIGKTPVMVMDSVPLPGLGTFSARVVFHDKKYAGTWKHDAVGGHLFGRVDRALEKAAK
ncbi:MAG TPA: hypothetical protein VM260_22125 [Pirellula sp.]|nr:hypothetical protein [Pirellula sp.]